MSGPDVVMVMRHAEKPADPPAQPPPHGVDIEGRHNKHSLLPRGWQRAGVIASVLSGEPAEPLRRPDRVLAPDYAKHTQDHRAIETVTPLAHRLGLQVETPVARGDEQVLVSDHLLTSRGTVLVCWEHHHIPVIAREFAKATGIAADRLAGVAEFWPEGDFCSVLVFTRHGDGYRVGETTITALPGDPV